MPIHRLPNTDWKRVRLRSAAALPSAVHPEPTTRSRAPPTATPGHDTHAPDLDRPAVKPTNDNFNGRLKYAHFNSSANAAPFVDTRKAWLQAEYKF